MDPEVWRTGAAYYAGGVVSAVVPWVNAEVVMISAIPIARTPVMLAELVVAVSLGQMTGKSALYWLSRRSRWLTGDRWRRHTDRFYARVERHRGSALSLTFISALVGFPPMFAVAIAAGTMRVAFSRFLAVGMAGRLVHFAVVAFAPGLLRAAF